MQVPAFSSHYRVVGYDLRGHGRSSNPDGRLGLELLADDTRQLCQFLRIDRAHFAGFSMGGCVLLHLVLRAPKLVKSLILVGANYRVDAKFLESISAEGARAISPWWSRALQEDHKHVYGPTYWRELLQQLSEEARRRRSLTPEDLRHIAAPTLLCVGDRDQFVSLEQVWEMQQHIPRAELLVVPAAPHWVHMREHRIFNDVALRFLRRVNGEPASGSTVNTR